MLRSQRYLILLFNEIKMAAHLSSTLEFIARREI